MRHGDTSAPRGESAQLRPTGVKYHVKYRGRTLLAVLVARGRVEVALGVADTAVLEKLSLLHLQNAD